MRYFIIAGEASGDLHGSDLVKNLLEIDSDAVISCWGGDLMEKEGARLLKHYRELAIMGFTEVIIHARRLLRFFKDVKSQIEEFKPDVVILIDYPGFNLRLAPYLKEKGIKVYYYISPKVWAWKKSRVKKIKRYVDRMYVIFPFEPEFYSGYDYRVYYFGNPLVDSVKRGLAKSKNPENFRRDNNLDERPLIALLAGSRMQEIKKLLPVMAKVCDYYPDYQFIVAGLGTIPEDAYLDAIGEADIKVIRDQTYSLLRSSDVALVTSGTATLETALARVPQVVCYRTSGLTYHLAKLFLKIRFISLVNLIMDKEIVRELIQDNLNEANLTKEINTLLPGGWKRGVMLEGYSKLSSVLGGGGAGKKVASDIFASLKILQNVN